MPRAKYTKPPGPFLAIEQIHRSKFRFQNEQWQKLTKLLPSKLGLEVRSEAAPRLLVALGFPPNATLPEKVKTFADLVIQATEDAINSHLTTSSLKAPMNPANVRAAIRRLRYSLRPFVRGWVDDETGSIIDWAKLDTMLATRDREIEKLRLPSAKQRLWPRSVRPLKCGRDSLLPKMVRPSNNRMCCVTSIQPLISHALSTRVLRSIAVGLLH